MSEFNESLLIANIYRYLLIVVGGAFGYWGYRLFVLGYFEKAGELKAAFGIQHILLKSVAPGVFFAAFGVATIWAGVYRGIEISVPAGDHLPMGMTMSNQNTPQKPSGDQLKTPMSTMSKKLADQTSEKPCEGSISVKGLKEPTEGKRVNMMSGKTERKDSSQPPPE